MKVNKALVERWNISKRMNERAKSEERKWRKGLAKSGRDEWEIEAVGQGCLIYRSKVFQK